MPAQPVADSDVPAERTVDYSSVTLSQVIMPVHAGPGGAYAHGGEIIKLMRDLAKKENRAVITVTHDPETARMADRILLLRDGKLVSELIGEFFRASGVDVETKPVDDSGSG